MFRCYIGVVSTTRQRAMGMGFVVSAIVMIAKFIVRASAQRYVVRCAVAKTCVERWIIRAVLTWAMRIDIITAIAVKLTIVLAITTGESIRPSLASPLAARHFASLFDIGTAIVCAVFLARA